MGKHMIDQRVVCSFYKHHDPSMIYCQGFKQGVTLHVAFDNRAQMHDFFDKCCRSDCESCRVYQALKKIKND